MLIVSGIQRIVAYSSVGSAYFGFPGRYDRNGDVATYTALPRRSAALYTALLSQARASLSIVAVVSAVWIAALAGASLKLEPACNP